jgi:hypothetical protein
MDGDRNLAYTNIFVDKRPVEGVIITPEEVTLDPEVGQLQLQAAIYPEYAEGDVVWTSSSPSYLSVDENGLVTLLNKSATLGETYYITAQVDDFIDTCVVHVSGEKYDLTVAGTRVTSLNKNDILGNGLAAYDNGKLYLGNGTFGSATYSSPVIISNMPTLEIQVNQQSRVRSKNSMASIYSTGNLIFTGTGALLVENRSTTNQSKGISAKSIVVRNRVTVYVVSAMIGTSASSGVRVTDFGTLKSNGESASLLSKNYFSGNIIEPAGATWDRLRGYVVIGSQIVKGQDVVITAPLPEPSFIRGDVNDDGNVNISDVTALINYLLTHDATNVNVSGADCDQSGSVAISDVTALINYLLTHSW